MKNSILFLTLSRGFGRCLSLDIQHRDGKHTCPIINMKELLLNKKETHKVH